MKRIDQGHILPVSVILIMLVSLFSAAGLAKSSIPDRYKGFDKGVSWKTVLPLRKVTFVNFDKDSYLDDYAYLSAIPTAVFYDKSRDRLISHPLLFYQDPYPVKDDKERTLDARKGIDYFMEDWMSYCNGRLDQMVLINVDKSKVRQWPAKDVIEISGDDPYEIASKIALHDWSYSDSAVIAVIEKNFEEEKESFSNAIKARLLPRKVKIITFGFPQTNKLNPQYKEFDVPEGYKYIEAHGWWAAISIDIDFLYSHIIIPAGNKDFQLYCKDVKRDRWMQVGAVALNSPQFGMDPEAAHIKSYVYTLGKWRIGLTDFPTKGVFNRYGTIGELLSNLIRGVIYNVEVRLYPGIEVELPDALSYGCRNVTITLTWNDPNLHLGFSLIGPNGERIVSVYNQSSTCKQEVKIDALGECLDGESYKIAVYSFDDIMHPVGIAISYSWNISKDTKKRDCLTSATEGAILASMLNTALLYTSTSFLPKVTIDTLYKLGVKKVYLVDVGNHVRRKVIDSLRDTGKVIHLKTCMELYDRMRKLSGSNDVIFSTIEPWVYWYVGELKPAGMMKGALFLGPSAYLSAHHGVPVLIVENHPKLHQAAIWHKEFWKRGSSNRAVYPGVSDMYLTGKKVYEVLDEYGFDREGMETIVTVAGQYNIGVSWDRVFVGKAKPGRVWGSPVDASQWISRIVFYPALIFENPALDPDGIKLINGSKSIRRFPWFGRLGLKIIKESGEEHFVYPVLHTYVCYAHRLNEMFSKYYGVKYQTADGIIPGETNSLNPIDEGVNEKYRHEKGCFYPDLTDSEIAPLYASRAGYSNVFSTSFEAVMENLNRGVIMWLHDGHGLAEDGGQGCFWSTEGIIKYIPFAGAKKEENPWRVYEWYLGSTENPDTMTMEIHGILPALLGNPHLNGIIRTGMAWAPAYKPIMNLLAKFVNLPVIRWFAPEWLKDTEDYYDGMVNTIFPSYFESDYYNASQLEDALRNLHSCGYITTNCESANTYYHLVLIRHGSPYQIMDPWPTSWYSSAWIQSIPRDIALGHTIGEAYVNGIKHVGILCIFDPPQWWWDIAENVVFYGDPDLRVWTSKNDCSSANHWEREDVQPLRWDGVKNLYVDGHCLFGATSYPHARKPIDASMIIAIAAISALVIAIGTAYYTIKKK